MHERFAIKHHIQRHIVDVLTHTRYARFRDLRPAKIDTNLYAYHLKLLQKKGYIHKAREGYTLGRNGLLFVDRTDTVTPNIRTQPVGIMMLVVQNSNGDLLLVRRARQPFVDTWTLPYGELHIEDRSVLLAAERIVQQKLGIKPAAIRHVGDCYIRGMEGANVMMSTHAHVCRFETDAIESTDSIQWVRPLKLGQFELAPAVEQIVTRAFFGDVFFFEEYETQFPVSTNES